MSVATRLRPLVPAKESSGGLAIQGNQIFVRPAVIAPSATPRAQVPIGFGFDRVFDDASSQEEVFTFAEDRVLTHFVEGYHGTIFAYGQTGTLFTMSCEHFHHLVYNYFFATVFLFLFLFLLITGSGKTHTMWGSADAAGVIPRALEYIFSHLPEGYSTTVSVSCMEIYNEDVYADQP